MMMKKFPLIIASMLVGQSLMAQHSICIQRTAETDYAPLSAIDSICLNAAADTLYLVPADTFQTVAIAVADIQHIGYLAEEDAPKKVKVYFNGSSATCINPQFMNGVKVDMDGAYVTVTNENCATEITSTLSGSTTNGSYTYKGNYKTTIELNGVDITSQKGAAIHIKCGKRVNLEVKKETVNTLVDMAGGEQKAALYCKGHLEIDKGGTLNVTGRTAHAISAKEYLKLKNSDGIINVLGAVKDGMHCTQYFVGNGFTTTIKNVKDDGIQCKLDDDNNATASTIIDDYQNGTLVINNGTYNVTLNTAATASNWGPGGGGGGGGWPGGGGDSNTATYKAIKCKGPAIINGGNLNVLTTISEAEGLESKTSVTINGGNHYFKCYDDCINSPGIILFNGGNTVCFSNGNDAVDSNYGKSGAITIAGGSVFAYTTKGSPEEGFDCDNNSYIKITGGIAISAGGSQGGGGGWGGSSSSQSVGSSTQGYYLGSSPSSYGTSYYYTLCNTSGTAICTYKFEASCSNSLSLLTAPDLGKGSVTVKYGTEAPTACESQVNNAAGNGVFFIAPTVTTKGTTATVTAK